MVVKDGIRVEATAYSGQNSGWTQDANFDFKSLGRYTDFGYEVEFIIPFSVFLFQVERIKDGKLT